MRAERAIKEDGPGVEGTGTRAKILEACRILFNERGPAEVTTAEIAQAVGISEGNLHYHFRRKQQILQALFDGFEVALDRVAADQRFRSARHAEEPYRVYLTEWFNLMWEWRCFYGASVYRLAPTLKPRLMALTDRGQAKVRQALTEMVAEGRLDASPEEIDRLVVNAWIVATYWIDYLRTRQGVEVVTRDHLRWGFAQVQALFTPHAMKRPVLTALAG
jgi:AcrR family transcriptional regulator